MTKENSANVEEIQDDNSAIVVMDALFELALQFTDHISFNTPNGLAYIFEMSKNEKGIKDPIFNLVDTRYALVTDKQMIVKQSDSLDEIMEYARENMF